MRGVVGMWFVLHDGHSAGFSEVRPLQRCERLDGLLEIERRRTWTRQIRKSWLMREVVLVCLTSFTSVVKEKLEEVQATDAG